MSTKPLAAFKGFNIDLKCRDFQYEIGKSYSHDSDVSICNSGFHACEMPLDTWKYYGPATSRYASVILSGNTAANDNTDTKIAAAKITIKAELKLPEIINSAVQWILTRAKGNTATGDYGRAAATGNYGHAAATGDYGHAAATGRAGHAAATGHYGHAAATGDSSHAAATGDSSHAAATGRYGHAAATGDSSHAAATGDSSHAAATGRYGHAAATGHSSHAAATGHSSHAAATGDYGHAAATGHSSHAAATGHSSHAAVEGQNSIAVALGKDSTAKAKTRGAIMLAAYDDNYNLIAVFSSKVGENGIKAGVTYRLNKNGKPIKA